MAELIANLYAIIAMVSCDDSYDEDVVRRNGNSNDYLCVTADDGKAYIPEPKH